MVLGLQPVGLRAAAGEGAGDDDAGGLADAGSGRMVAPDDDPELIQQGWGDDQAVVVIDLVFPVLHIDARLGQNKAAHAAVLLGGVVEVAADGGQVVLGELVGDGGGDLGVALRVGGDLLQQAAGSEGVDHGLQVLLFAIDRNHERILLAVAHRPQQAAFIDAPLLGRPHGGERIARIQMVVAEQEIECPVIDLRGRLGDDLDAAAAGTRELRGIGILIDLHLLDGRRAHAHSTLFHAVHHQGDASRCRSIRDRETATWWRCNPGRTPGGCPSSGGPW